MNLTAHQPVYLPWLGLFHKIALCETFVFFNDVQYLVKDWNNRNRIKTHAGPIWLTVPVLTKGHLTKPIRTIEINNALPWRRKHWKSIVGSYGSAPYFSRYADFWEDLYQRDWTHLSDLNEYMLHYLLRELGLAPKFLKASEFSFKGAKSDLVLDMCKTLGATTYIFGELGTQYAETDKFLAEGIVPMFQNYQHPSYSQLHGAFVPYMSILDLMFNCGPNSMQILMSGNIRKTELRHSAIGV